MPATCTRKRTSPPSACLEPAPQGSSRSLPEARGASRRSRIPERREALRPREGRPRRPSPPTPTSDPCPPTSPRLLQRRPPRTLRRLGPHRRSPSGTGARRTPPLPKRCRPLHPRHRHPRNRRDGCTPLSRPPRRHPRRLPRRPPRLPLNRHRRWAVARLPSRATTPPRRRRSRAGARHGRRPPLLRPRHLSPLPRCLPLRRSPLLPLHPQALPGGWESSPRAPSPRKRGPTNPGSRRAPAAGQASPPRAEGRRPCPRSHRRRIPGI